MHLRLFAHDDRLADSLAVAASAGKMTIPTKSSMIPVMPVVIPAMAARRPVSCPPDLRIRFNAMAPQMIAGI